MANGLGSEHVADEEADTRDDFGVAERVRLSKGVRLIRLGSSGIWKRQECKERKR